MDRARGSERLKTLRDFTGSSDIDNFSPRKESREGDGPVGVGSIEATSHGPLLSGHLRGSELKFNNQDSARDAAASTDSKTQDSSRSGVLNTDLSDGGKEYQAKAEGMLELEHMIGYTGHFAQTVVAHPQDSGVIITCVGALLIVGGIEDHHQQHLLRGHDMEISALAVSQCGSLIATGQCGSTRRKGYPSPVFLWDYATRTRLYILQGLSEGVCHLSFSPDRRFLLGCGGDHLVYFWDTSTGELVSGKQYAESTTLGEWVAVKQSGRRATYHICLCVGCDVVALELSFDPTRHQWTLSGGSMRTPNVGLRRRYHCSTLHDGGKFLVCGTDVGDLVVFGVDAKIFRASIPVSSGGMLSVCADYATGAVLCGGGNGVLRKIIGSDMVWHQEKEIKLDGGVISLSTLAGGCELLAGTQEGSVYRLLLADLSMTKVSSSQKSPVLSVACGSRVDTFATCARDGTVRVWDLCNFNVVVEAPERPRGAGGGALCITWLGEDAVITGWNDCFVRCYDVGTGMLRWEIPQAHRAAVTCCAVRSDVFAAFLVTGSEDGSVRVWELRSRKLLLGFSEHQKRVGAVLVDAVHPHLVHSVGEDCTVLTYDLRKERRTIVHITRTGAFQSMTQRLDSENELITCDVHGRLLMWDCDYREPVQTLQDPSQKRLSCISVSPSGRYMVLGGDEETIKVLDLKNNCEAVACGRAHASAITSVQWTKDERQIISAAEDCSLAIWNFFGASASSPLSDRSASNGKNR